MVVVCTARHRKPVAPDVALYNVIHVEDPTILGLPRIAPEYAAPEALNNALAVSFITNTVWLEYVTLNGRDVITGT